jgi:putative ABC transport system substrate-binding protein
MEMRVDALFLVFLFLLAPAGFVALPGAAAHAQDRQGGKVYHIGFLRAGPPPKMWVEALKQGLQERGYVEGQNLVLEFRFTEGSLDRAMAGSW